MSLSSTLSIAQSALANTAAQSALLSRNIANVNNSNYSLRSAGGLTQVPGGVATGPTQRAQNAALLANLLSAQSASASNQAMSEALDQIATSLGLNGSSSTSDRSATDNSPATLIGALSNALRDSTAAPDNAAAGAAVVTAAKALAASLNQASSNVQATRGQVDSDMTSSVATINSLLSQFKTANDAVVVGARTGIDVSDAMDTRDSILKQLSSEIGITTVPGTSGGLSIYTDSGVTLFETSPRTVAFTPTTAYAAGTNGQAVTVDGVAVTGPSAVMPIKSGKLAGLATFRDITSTAYQNQLDQIASSLVTSFAETDRTGGGAPTLAGLFTAAGSTGLPTSATGLAASLKVNARVDPSAGGDLTRLRDGNIASADSAYTYNTSGAAGFAGRLNALTAALSQTRSFDASSGGAASASLTTYAQSSVSWLEAQRQSASENATAKSATVAATTTALSNATGVNLDDQMSTMLDVEHAYQASAQLMSTVNAMYATLLQAFN